jgi:hypothetical protein
MDHAAFCMTNIDYAAFYACPPWISP